MTPGIEPKGLLSYKLARETRSKLIDEGFRTADKPYPSSEPHKSESSVTHSLPVSLDHPYLSRSQALAFLEKIVREDPYRLMKVVEQDGEHFLLFMNPGHPGQGRHARLPP